MARIVKRGTGITARNVTMFDVTGNTPGDIEAARDAFRKGDREFWQSVSEHGLFAASTVNIRDTCNAILAAAGDRGDFEEDSPEFFARRIIWLLDIATEAVKRGDPEGSAVYALKAGDLWRTAAMKWEWEPAAMSGAKYLAKSAEGAAKRRGTTEPHVQAALAEMDRLTGEGHSVSRAAELAAGRGFGTSASANRAAWNRRKRAERKL